MRVPAPVVDLHVAFGRIAGLVALAGFLPYVVAILRRQTRPNRATWWIWTVVGALLCVSYYSAGARDAIWVPVSYVAGPFVTALLALRYGEGGWTRLDRFCLAGAALSLAIWWGSGSALLALLMNVLLDAFGAIPTVWKTWAAPESEDLAAWVCFFAGSGLNLLALDGWTIESALYPVYLTGIAAVMVMFILRGRLTGAKRRTD